MKKDKKTYIKLFTSVFYLSAFTFGGGYVIVPLMKKKFVDELKWINEEEMLNLIAVGQSAPGAIAINTALLVGYKTSGVLGAAISVFAAVLPPLITISIISLFYEAYRDNKIVTAVLYGMQAGVAAVIISAVLSFAKDVMKDKSIISAVIMVITFILSYFLKINVAYIVILSAALGAVIGIYNERKRGREIK